MNRLGLFLEVGIRWLLIESGFSHLYLLEGYFHDSLK